jgi:hypothetical protein
MEPEGSLPCSREPSTGPYPEPDQSNTIGNYLEAALRESRQHLDIFVDGLRTITEGLRHDSRSLGPNSNRAPPE